MLLLQPDVSFSRVVFKFVVDIHTITLTMTNLTIHNYISRMKRKCMKNAKECLSLPFGRAPIMLIPRSFL